jgi:hypothetical protein
MNSWKAVHLGKGGLGLSKITGKLMREPPSGAPTSLKSGEG